MPQLIPKHEAVARIEADGLHRRNGCLMCALVEEGAVSDVLASDQHCTAILSRYPRSWGHMLVIPRVHATDFVDLDPAAWRAATDLAYSGARVLERVLNPARCYVASLGTASGDVPMSSPHIHLHVLPVQDPQISPGRMLSWDDGVWQASEAEWAALRLRLANSWAGLA